MKITKVELEDLYNKIEGLTIAQFLSTAMEKLSTEKKSDILTAIFLHYPNWKSQTFIAHLGFLFEGIVYDDVLNAMEDVGSNNESAFYFASYVPEFLGVDLIAVMKEINYAMPHKRKKFKYFSSIKKLIEPTNHTVSLLKEYGANPEKIWEGLVNSGAPMLPLPTSN